MLSRSSARLALVLVALAPTPAAYSQARPEAAGWSVRSANLATPGPLRTAVARIRVDAGDPATPANHASSTAPLAPPRSRVVARIVFASVGGVGGFIGGGTLGARIDGPCGCDDPGLNGALIGAPIGALVGAVVGWTIGGLVAVESNDPSQAVTARERSRR